MNNQDPIADMLTRIRNANRVGRRLVLIPKSKICSGIAQVLKDEGYIDDYDVVDDARESTAASVTSRASSTAWASPSSPPARA
jgi:ribosomal protein S8